MPFAHNTNQKVKATEGNLGQLATIAAVNTAQEKCLPEVWDQTKSAIADAYKEIAKKQYDKKVSDHPKTKYKPFDPNTQLIVKIGNGSDKPDFPAAYELPDNDGFHVDNEIKGGCDAPNVYNPVYSNPLGGDVSLKP